LGEKAKKKQGIFALHFFIYFILIYLPIVIVFYIINFGVV